MTLDDLLKLRIAPSQIEGVGVFATRDIAQGEKLYADTFPQLFEVAALSEDIAGRHPYAFASKKLIYPDIRFMAYMNHSDQPNYDAKNDVALVDIKAGDEITEDYREIDNWADVYPWLVV